MEMVVLWEWVVLGRCWWCCCKRGVASVQCYHVLGISYCWMVVLSMAAAAVVGLPEEVERWAVAERDMPILGHSTQFDGEAGGSLSGVQSLGL